jgi:proliferating cell nuclear antigen
MRILEVKTVQSGAFRILVEALKEILTDVNIDFTKKVETVNDKGEVDVEGGMGIIAMNSSNSVLIHLKLDAYNFDEYSCTKDKLTIGVNMTFFFKLIKTMNNTDTLTLYMDDDDTNRLGIRIENSDKNLVSTWKLNLMDLEDYDIRIPPTEFTSVINMPAQEFHKICRDLNPIADNIEIKSVGKKLIFTTKGEIAHNEIIIGESGSGLNVTLDEEESDTIIQGIYDLKNLTLFTKCTNLCSNIDIYMKNDYPLVIRYAVASLGQIHLCLSSNSDDINNEEEYISDDYDLDEDLEDLEI